MEDYKKKYEDLITSLKKAKDDEMVRDDRFCVVIDNIFPELKESEDEKIIKSVTRLVKAFYDVNFPTPEGFSRKDLLAWLERQGEEKSTWSEEDEEMFDAVIADIQFTQKAHTHEVNQVVYEREIDWLKSIKDRYTWKPSKGQIELLEKIRKSKITVVDSVRIDSLIQELKKL